MKRKHPLIASLFLALPLLSYAQPPNVDPNNQRARASQEFREPLTGGQDFGGRGFGGGGFGGFGGGGSRAQRSDFPMWSNPQGFATDTFTFARIQYTSRNAGGWGNRWSNDYPDSDWNFSYRLSEMTTMHVDPMGRVLDLTDPELLDYPFVFMNGVGTAEFSDEEATALRKYLLRGGFMMVDDFWGDAEWENMVAQMEKVLRVCNQWICRYPILSFIWSTISRPNRKYPIFAPGVQAAPSSFATLVRMVISYRTSKPTTINKIES